MAKFLKIIGSGHGPCPEPYDEPYVDFSPTRNPKGKINIGDELILYAAGGRKTVFAQATVVSDSYGGDDPGWPFRLDVVYDINVPPSAGPLIDKVSVDRDLGTSLLRQSYIRLSDAEFENASRLLHLAEERHGTNRKHFTAYWKNDTWKNNSASIPNGGLLDHTASNDFRKRGVTPGDAVYVVTAIRGKLYVAAKIIVEKVLDRADASLALGRTDLWEATDHIIASRSTPINWNRMVPMDIIKKLEFVTQNSTPSKLIFRSSDQLDEQTLRGIRQLSSESAALMDTLLPPLKRLDYLWSETSESGIASLKELESFPEGNKTLKYVTVYERDPKNRDEAVRIHGHTCKGCGINFEERYGAWGKGFIHVHHVKPVSQFERPKQIDPRSDLTVLCPNCHAMVHRKRTTTLSIEELQELINKAAAK